MCTVLLYVTGVHLQHAKVAKSISKYCFLFSATPGPPYNLSVHGVSKRHVDLQWDAPKNDGGKPVLR